MSFLIAASVAEAVTVNLNGAKSLLANGFNGLFVKGNPVFSNGRGSLPRNCTVCIVLDN